MKRILLVSLLISALFMYHSITVNADGVISVDIDKSSYISGEYVKVIVSCPDSSNLGAFLVTTVYDAACIKYVKTECSSTDYIRTHDDLGTTATVYTYAGTDSSYLTLTITYKLLPDCDNVSLQTSVEQIVDRNGYPLQDGFTVSSEAKVHIPSSEAMLFDLVPSDGGLNEEFSASITSYSMNVPYAVDSLTFDVVASDGAKVTVNRKNLGSGGSTTVFNISVTSEDGSTKTVYTVAVTRGEYIRSQSSDNNSKAEIVKDEATDGMSAASENEEISIPPEVSEPESNMIMPKDMETEITKVESDMLFSGNTFMYFIAGVGTAVVCVLIGAAITLMLMRKDDKTDKR